MLIKYRSGVIHSAQSIKCINATEKAGRRTIVHMKSSFTFKRPISRWQPVICINRSTPKMSTSGKNGVLSMSHYHSILENTPLGMIYFPKYSSHHFFSLVENEIHMYRTIQTGTKKTPIFILCF